MWLRRATHRVCAHRGCVLCGWWLAGCEERTGEKIGRTKGRPFHKGQVSVHNTPTVLVDIADHRSSLDNTFSLLLCGINHSRRSTNSQVCSTPGHKIDGIVKCASQMCMLGCDFWIASWGLCGVVLRGVCTCQVFRLVLTSTVL
jgi:hypothetical protein